MSTIEAIQKENAELRRIVENHAYEIEKCKTVIYQLVGGLFNQKTQNGIVNEHISQLCRTKHKHDEEHAVEDEEDEDEDEEYGSIWPTTRQGDEHEERLRKMEEIMKNIEERVLSVENKLM
jgi:hypothetical protein